MATLEISLQLALKIYMVRIGVSIVASFLPLHTHLALSLACCLLVICHVFFFTLFLIRSCMGQIYHVNMYYTHLKSLMH